MRIFSLQKVVLFLVLWTALLFSPLLSAHNFDADRRLVFEVGPDEISIFLVYSEPAGKRTDRLMAIYDTDQNGRLDRSESKRSVAELQKRAIHGMNFSRHIDWSSADFRVRHTRRSGISIAILLKISRGFISIFLPRVRGNLPLTVLGKGDDFVLSLDSDGQQGAFEVRPGYAAILKPKQIAK